MEERAELYLQQLLREGLFSSQSLPEYKTRR
jgi:hypothetical protein